METLCVPKRGVSVRLLFEGGQELDGEVYVPATGPYGGPGRLIDRLNDHTEDFMPLSTAGGEVHLVNKARILAVEVAADQEEPEEIDALGSRQVEVEVTVLGGLTLSGQLWYAMPPGQRRTLDFLNASPVFFPLLDQEKTTLVRRMSVVSVRERDAGSTQT